MLLSSCLWQSPTPLTPPRFLLSRCRCCCPPSTTPRTPSFITFQTLYQKKLISGRTQGPGSVPAYPSVMCACEFCVRTCLYLPPICQATREGEKGTSLRVPGCWQTNGVTLSEGRQRARTPQREIEHARLCSKVSGKAQAFIYREM